MALIERPSQRALTPAVATRIAPAFARNALLQGINGATQIRAGVIRPEIVIPKLEKLQPKRIQVES